MLAGGGVLAAGALAVVETEHTVAFTAGEIAIVSALLAAVAGALGLMFRTLQAEKEGRIATLGAELDHAQAQVATLQTALTAQTERTVALLQGEVASSRDALLRFTARADDLREENRRAHDRSREEHRVVVATLRALGQAQGVPLGEVK